MTMRLTVSLPDAVYRSAVRLAQLTRRDVSEALCGTLALSLPALPADGDAVIPMAGLSDAEILAAADLALPTAQDRQLGLLLDRRQAGTLAAEEQTTRRQLMQAYLEGPLRKARGLHEAGRRGLREPRAP